MITNGCGGVCSKLAGLGLEGTFILCTRTWGQQTPAKLIIYLMREKGFEFFTNQVLSWPPYKNLK